MARTSMRRPRRLVTALLSLTLAITTMAAVTAPGFAQEVPEAYVTEWISQAEGAHELPAMSADGRYLVYVGRGEGQGVYVKDRTEPLTEPAELVAAGDLMNPDISGDGRFVAWVEYGDPRGVFVKEWQNPQAVAELVSLPDDGHGGQPVKNPDFPALNYDGRYVAFQSMNDDLDDGVSPGESGGPNKVYVRDRLEGDTEMISVTNANAVVNGQAIWPDITPDGRYVVFASDASVLQETEAVAAAPGGDEGEEETEVFQQIYLRDRVEKTTTMVSLNLEGEPGNGNSAAAYGPRVSDDATKVSFDSDASDLVAEDTNESTDAFVRNLTTMTTVRVSVNSDGSEAEVPDSGEVVTPIEITVAAPPEGKGPGGEGGDDGGEDLTPNVGAGPVISGDGSMVAFESMAALTADDENTTYDECVGVIRVDDDDNPTTPAVPIDVTVTGSPPVKDVYAYDLDSDTIVRQSVAEEDGVETSGYRVDGNSKECVAVSNGGDPAISYDGTRVAFTGNGNLSGDRIAEEEESHDEEAAAAEVVEPFAGEPSVFLRRPDPEAPFTQPATITAAAAPTAISEAAGVSTVTFTRDGSVGGLTIGYELSGTATYADDYTADPAAVGGEGAVVFLDGQSTALLKLTAVEDAILDAAETVIVTIASGPYGAYTVGVPASATVTITDNDGGGGGGGGGGGTIPTPTPTPTPTTPAGPVPACPNGVGYPEFSDVPAANTHRGDIECAAWWQLAFGLGEGQFGPGQPMTRAQTAAFMVRLMQRAGYEFGEAPDAFDDDNGNIHEQNINRLAASGLIVGLGERQFGPNEPISREQMVTMLVQATERLMERELERTENVFVDAVNSVHLGNIEKAVGAGFVLGYDETHFGPTDDVRRDQMASFLIRVVQRLLDEQLLELPA